MTLDNGFYDVPPGKVAAIVTDLEMRQRAEMTQVDAPDGWALHPVNNALADWYRSLYRLVGENCLWWSRLELDDAALEAILQHHDVELFVLQNGTELGGIVELDHRDPERTELAFFGVSHALIGTRAARYMMNFAIRTAWARPIKLLYVHTCTLDSPKAVDFYRRSGFVPVRQQVEIADDPRLKGILPMQAAPQIPIFK